MHCLSVYWPHTEVVSEVILFFVSLLPYLYNTLKQMRTVECHLVSCTFMESPQAHKNHFSSDNRLESEWFKDDANQLCLVSSVPIMLSYVFQETCILHLDLFIKNWFELCVIQWGNK